VNFNSVKINTDNYTTRSKNSGGVSFCGDDYFKQGAVVQPQDADKFVKEHAFTTTKQILQTKLRQLPDDAEIDKMLGQFRNKAFVQKAREYLANSALEHEPYYEWLCSTNEAVKKIKGNKKFGEFLLKLLNPIAFINKSIKAKVDKRAKRAKFYESIVKSYEKAGLKNFIGNRAVNHPYSTDAQEKSMLDFLHLIKSKYLDSGLSDDVKKIIQRIYDDFGVIAFSANDTDHASAIYNALQDARKTALSVGDKPPKFNLVDAVSMYTYDKRSVGGFYIISMVSHNSKYIDNISDILKHEMGHALHYDNNRDFLNKLFYKYRKTPVMEYAKKKGIRLKQDFVEVLTRVFEKAKIKDYKDEIDYALSNPLEFVAVLKQYSNSIDFANMPANAFEQLKKLLEACGAPKGFFADRIMLPKNLNPTDWKKFGQELLKQAKHAL
jgi:hypothetical protein